MRIDRLASRPRRREQLRRHIIYHIEDRGQAAVLAGFLVAFALGYRAAAYGWLLGGCVTLLSFHQLAASVHRSLKMKEREAGVFLGHRYRRRVQLALLALGLSLVVPGLDARATFAGLFATKAVIYFSAPSRALSITH
ncbi:MAG: ATP synthase subunit I [Bacillota bacterium]